ncbi:MAG: N-formylglutamate amidohydrolase [Planctomycetota bacterium]
MAERAPGRAESPFVLVTCEHASAAIPKRWQPLFERDREVLATHRAFDPGAAAVARALAQRLSAEAILGGHSRLLVDLNRSPGHPRLFSEWTRSLPDTERKAIFERYYMPYREKVVRWIETHRGPVSLIHCSIHSFTPVLDGQVRATDVGLLYDPSRTLEGELVGRIQKALRDRLPSDWKIHRNQPYKGISDGLIPGMRRQFPAEQYVGVEIEMNQRHLSSSADRQRLGQWIVESIVSAI